MYKKNSFDIVLVYKDHLFVLKPIYFNKIFVWSQYNVLEKKDSIPVSNTCRNIAVSRVGQRKLSS